MKGAYPFMSVIDKFSLGFSTAMIGMGIVFIVLIVLWGIIVLEHKFFEFSAIGAKQPASEEAAPPAAESGRAEKSGRSQGEVKIAGISDEDAVIILAAISEDSDIPMEEMRIKSIAEIG